MPNPYESPTTPAEKPTRLRAKVAWGKRLAMGVGSWLGAAVLMFALLAAGLPYTSFLHVVCWALSDPLTLLLTALEVEPTATIFVPAILSGILLHATFWTVVFSWWRRRASQSYNASE